MFYNLMICVKLVEWNMYFGKLMLYLIVILFVFYYVVFEEVLYQFFLNIEVKLRIFSQDYYFVLLIKGNEL